MSTTIASGDFTYVIEDNGLPSGLILPEELSRHNLLSEHPSLVVTTGDSRKLYASATEKIRCLTRHNGEAQVVEFQRIGLENEQGVQGPGFRLTLKHEIYPDGTVFTDGYFMSDETRVPIPFSRMETSPWIPPSTLTRRG